ncbi:MAG: hypothetical protein JST00_43010, partial [Deltaproteobacteria bacterium]|nr:hypothetical protein [Deltaproteobacteria bacterium]
PPPPPAEDDTSGCTLSAASLGRQGASASLLVFVALGALLAGRTKIARKRKL